MSETTKATGQCLCKAVQIHAATANRHLGACHCSMCRKWTGGPLLVLECGSDVRFTGENNITVYNSSDWAERGFCKQCGTHLFYRLKQGQLYFIPAGLFDDVKGITFSQQVFIEQKPGYYEFTSQTHNLTGAQVFAQFAPPES